VSICKGNWENNLKSYWPSKFSQLISLKVKMRIIQNPNKCSSVASFFMANIIFYFGFYFLVCIFINPFISDFDLPNIAGLTITGCTGSFLEEPTEGFFLPQQVLKKSLDGQISIDFDVISLKMLEKLRFF
jgi:hypothetical protein